MKPTHGAASSQPDAGDHVSVGMTHLHLDHDPLKRVECWSKQEQYDS
jgi:hypothetical protein